MERREQSGMTHDSAKAEATVDWKHNNTVTLSFTIHLGDNNSQTAVISLSEPAANSLLSELLLIAEPAKPRFDVTVETTDSFDEHENVEYTLRERRLDIRGNHGSTVYNFDRVLRVTAVPHEES